MGSFGASISGLQSSQQWLDVISNNIANSETVGFKASEVNFATLISNDLSSPSADDSSQNIGGVDAMQVGLGVTVGDIALDLNQGSIETTGNVTDIAIQGQGYLTVKDGTQTLYTRAGNLTFDSNGDLVTADGGLVQGWSLLDNVVDANPNDADVAAYGTGYPAGNPLPPMVSSTETLNTNNTAAIGNIIIPNNLELAPQQSLDGLNPNEEDAAGVTLAGNLDSYTPDTSYNILVADGIDTANADAVLHGANAGADAELIQQNADATSNFTVYDSLGTPINMTVYWYQTDNTPANNAQWSYFIFDTSNGTAPTGDVNYPDAGAFILSGGTGGDSKGGDVAATTFTDTVSFNNNGTLATNGNDTVIGENPTITLDNFDGSITPFTFSIDLGTPNIPGNPATWGKANGLTGDFGGGTTDATTGVYTPNSDVYTKESTGYEKGTLTGLSFNQTGGIEATFTNGQTIVVAQLALSNFTNPGGLESIGGNYFETTDNSGSIQVGTAGSDGFGTIQGGALEESNVDLSTELTNMILAQTMYQANAKVITTQGDLYNDLFNAIPQQ